MTTRNQKRSVFWVDTIDQVNILPTASTQEVDLLPPEALGFQKGKTITRIILSLTLEPGVIDTLYRVS